MSNNDEITEINTLDTARILDQKENDWTAGYLMVYRRLKHISPIEAITFDNLTQTYTSKEFNSEPYSKFTLLIDLAVTGTPTDIVIEVEFSPGGIVSSEMLWILQAFISKKTKDRE